MQMLDGQEIRNEKIHRRICAFCNTHDDSFTQSAGEVSGEPLKFERNSSGIIVRNTDGRQLMQVNYSQEDDQLYYTIQTPEGDSTYYFTRAAE